MVGKSTSFSARKSKRDRARQNPVVSFRRLQIEEIIAAERQEKNHMVKFMVATIGLMFGQVPLEVQVTAEDEQGMTAAEIQNAVDHIIGQGFTPRTYSRNDAGSKMDKTGTVTGVKAIPDTKMYEVTGLLDNGAGEFKWKEFTATTFRKGDRFKVGKNDRGFFGGILIIDEGEQQELPM